MAAVSLSHLLQHLITGGTVLLPRKAVFAIKEQTSRRGALLWARERFVVKMWMSMAEQPLDPDPLYTCGGLSRGLAAKGTRKDDSWMSQG